MSLKLVGAIREFDPDDIFRRNTLLIGSTTAGKTTIVKSLCKQLSGKIANALIFSKMDETKKDYSGYMFPKLCVKKQIDIDLVYETLELQKKRVLWKNASWDYDKVGEIISKYLPNGKKIMQSLNEQLPTDTISNREAYVKKALTEIMRPLLKNEIYDKIDDLDYETKQICKYMNTNIDLLLIFEDVTQEFKQLMKAEKKTEHGKIAFFRAFIDVSRHNNTTMIIALHTVNKVMGTDTRGEAFHITIYVERGIAIKILKETGYKTEDIERILPTAAQYVDYWRLVFIKSKGYYHFKALQYDELFRVPDKKFFEYCEFVEKKMSERKSLF